MTFAQFLSVVVSRGGKYAVKKYTLEEIIELYKEEYPEWTDKKIKIKARKFHRKIDNYDRNMRRIEREFYDNEIPTGLII